MNTTEVANSEDRSQMGKTSFRKLFKQRSNKSLEDGKNTLLDKINKNLSVRKLQTKLGQIAEGKDESTFQNVL